MFYPHYHVTWDKPNDVWPHGAWSVYNITGDEIADRIVKVDGKVTERHSWCGYIGMVATIEELGTLLEKHRVWVAYAQARLADGHSTVTSFDHWTA